MSGEVQVEVLERLSDEDATRLGALLAQLSSATAPSNAELEGMLGQQGVQVLVARDETGAIVGTLSLCSYRTITGIHAIIEDVVVDEASRGQGTGAKLMTAAMAAAEELGARHLDLTSRPSREAANALYRKLGFEQRDTNVYRYRLSGH